MKVSGRANFFLKSKILQKSNKFFHFVKREILLKLKIIIKLNVLKLKNYSTDKTVFCSWQLEKRLSSWTASQQITNIQPLLFCYSQVPIKRVGPNKRVGWIFIKYFCLSLCLFLSSCFFGAK